MLVKVRTDMNAVAAVVSLYLKLGFANAPRPSDEPEA
jgi:hypothetical protein